MPAAGSTESQRSELYARAQAARRQSQALTGQLHAVRDSTAEICQHIQAARRRAEQLHRLWLEAHADASRLTYSPYARLQARLASMPVIEQAKGIIMAQCGWTGGQAFDALRRASQRENIKVRELAAQIVARTGGSAPAQRQPVSPPGQAAGADAHVREAALAGAAAHRTSPMAAG